MSIYLFSINALRAFNIKINLFIPKAWKITLNGLIINCMKVIFEDSHKLKKNRRKSSKPQKISELNPNPLNLKRTSKRNFCHYL